MGRGIFFRSAPAIAMAAALMLPGAVQAAGGGHGASAPAGAGAESNGQKVTPSLAYVPVDTLTATVSRDFRARGVMQVDAGLEIRDETLRARAIAMKPRLRDAYTAALVEYTGANYLPGRAPDTERLHAMMQAATDRTLGAPGADFLLGMVVVH